MIIKNTVKMHSEGLCEGLNRSKTKVLNKHSWACTRVCAFHGLKCVGGAKAGAEGRGALLGVQIYSSVSRGSGRKPRAVPPP